MAKLSWQERLWLKLRPKENGCWEYIGCQGHGGYGLIGIGYKLCKAHIVAYESVFGPVPKGTIMRHTCDNPRCCRPGHLIPGTQKQNIRDAMDRGRWLAPPVGVGEDNGQAKLTKEEVLKIRGWYGQPGWNQYTLAAHFNVGRSQIARILKRLAWDHV